MMKLLAAATLFYTLLATCHCQQYPQYPQQQQQQGKEAAYPTRPPPAILTHKQALNHDGNFKYLFTSENGLAQGETIAPDGTRTGGYSYIDPNGRKISLKYTAGKEGFKILEADHLPKAPEPVAPVPAPSAAPASYAQPQSGQDDGSYRPEQYERPQQQTQAYYQPRPAYQPARAQYPQLRASPSPATNEIGEREPEYTDPVGKPYSFGSGYLFEFGSG